MIAALSERAVLRKVALDEVELGHIILAHDTEKDTVCIFKVRRIERYGDYIEAWDSEEPYGLYVDSSDEPTHSFYVIEEAL